MTREEQIEQAKRSFYYQNLAKKVHKKEIVLFTPLGKDINIEIPIENGIFHFMTDGNPSSVTGNIESIIKSYTDKIKSDHKSISIKTGKMQKLYSVKRKINLNPK